ncbi:unnamed protein product [Trifolium pratense]|uniref:Uncharacterized protein n=1 Tax=Trifolium pratense TaxID=57577 RepID=A0ACB0IPE1_TRIPR|nr:unnamed protein product [Trifolium pratense]
MEDIWTMKKQLPNFMGTDPVGWIASAERFFEKNEVPSRDKLQWAFMSMEDKQAMMWFYYWCEENPDAEWESFSKAMIVRFGTQSEPSQEKSLPENQEIQLELGKASEATEDVVLLAFSDDGREVYVTKAGEMFNEALSETQRSENERVIVFDSLPKPPPKPPELQNISSLVVIPDRESYMEATGTNITGFSATLASFTEPPDEATPCTSFPPPEPPDLSSPYPPLPELTNSGQSAMAFYRIALLPTPSKTPGPPDAGSRDFSRAQKPTLPANLNAVGNIRISTELSEADQVCSVVVEKILEKIGVEWTLSNLGMILDHMSQGQLNVSLLGETLESWTEFNDMGLFLMFDVMGQAYICLLNCLLSSVAKLFQNQVQGLINIIIKLEACDHVLVVSTVDTYSKLGDYVGRVSTLLDTYSKLVYVDFALGVFKKWEFIGEFKVVNAYYKFSGNITRIPSYIHKEGTNGTTLLCVLCSFVVFFSSKTFGGISRCVLYREVANHMDKCNKFRPCTNLQQVMVWGPFMKLVEVIIGSNLAKEKEESCSYSPLCIEVLTTKGSVVGGGLLPRSTFISGFAQQERRICVVGDGTTIITVGGALMNLKLREAFSGRVFAFIMLSQSLIGCGNVFRVLEQISARAYASFPNLGIDLEASSYSGDFTNVVVINSIKKIIILTSCDWKKEVTSLLLAFYIEIFAIDDSTKGAAVLLEIAENAAMNKYIVRSLFDTNDWLVMTFVEILAQFWNTLMGSLEEMKTGFPFGMVSLRAFRQWEPGELNLPMATGTCDCCWNLIIFYGCFNFVFDRGKLDRCKFSTLRTRLI